MAFPEQVAICESDRVTVKMDALEAYARQRLSPNFDLELFGFEPKVSIYFVIDKTRSVGARQQLAAAVRVFLRSTSGDVALTYLDTLILKRVGATALCASAYADMLPEDRMGWTIIPELEQPE